MSIISQEYWKKKNYVQLNPVIHLYVLLYAQFWRDFTISNQWALESFVAEGLNYWWRQYIESMKVGYGRQEI